MNDMDNKIKFCKLFNEIFDSQIQKYLDLINDANNIPRESRIFLESANNSINNCIKLINDDEYVDSLCLLRSAFEAIMFSLAIYFDDETYKVYKHYDSNIYRKVLNEKYKKMKQKDQKFKMRDIDKKSKDLLAPAKMREIVAKNYNKVFDEVFYGCESVEEVKEELRVFYKYLCDFTHPSIVKTYVFKIQNDDDSLNNIRAVFKLNINYCKILLLLALNFFTSKDDMSDIYDLYALLFIFDINMITDVDNLNKLLKKYEDYLYLEITRKYFMNNDKRCKELQEEVKLLNEMDDFSEKLTESIKNIIIKFDAMKILNKYFQ